MSLKKIDGSLSHEDLLDYINRKFDGEVRGAKTQSGAPAKNSSDPSLNLPQFARDLVTSNLPHFAGLFGRVSSLKKRIKRVYTRQEVRSLVAGCLISEYQIPRIIEAVTDYLYEVSDLEKHMPEGE